MKAKLIKLSDEHYIVVDDSEIKDCYYYNSMDKAIRFGNNLNHPYHYEITHSTQPLEFEYDRFVKEKFFDNIKKISMSEVEEVIYGYSVEKTAYDRCQSWEHFATAYNVNEIPEDFMKHLLPKTEWDIEIDTDNKIKLI